MYSIQIDTSGFDRTLAKLVVLSRQTVPHIAEENRKQILALTAAGISVDGKRFHDYGRAQEQRREEANLQTDTKDLFFSGDMLGSLAFTASGTGGELTVGEKFKDIALGQQTGHSGDWPYQHVFIGVNEWELQHSTEHWVAFMTGQLHAG